MAVVDSTAGERLPSCISAHDFSCMDPLAFSLLHFFLLFAIKMMLYHVVRWVCVFRFDIISLLLLSYAKPGRHSVFYANGQAALDQYDGPVCPWRILMVFNS